MADRRARTAVGLAALVAIAALACLLRLMIDRPPEGGLGLAWPEALYARYRLTATGAGALVGAALALAGLLLQVLMRNPLASPFLLGVSSGAGLGVMIGIWFAWEFGVEGGRIPRIGPATAGAVVTLAIVYALGQRRGWLDPVTLVLVGVIVSTMCAAATMAFQHLVPLTARGELVSWMMGHVPETLPASILVTAVIAVVVAGAFSAWLGRAMDAATLSDDEARSVGLALGPFRIALFVTAGVLTAIAVAIAGPIGFVGLVCPHAARLLLGPRHGPLVPGSILAGIALVVGADAAQQLIRVSGGRMPVGVFTAIIGGFAFLWLLRSGRGQV